MTLSCESADDMLSLDGSTQYSVRTAAHRRAPGQGQAVVHKAWLVPRKLDVSKNGLVETKLWRKSRALLELRTAEAVELVSENRSDGAGAGAGERVVPWILLGGRTSFMGLEEGGAKG